MRNKSVDALAKLPWVFWQTDEELSVSESVTVGRYMTGKCINSVTDK